MTLTYQTMSLNPIQNHTFTFPDTISQFAVGISSFYFAFSKDHHVQQISLALTSNQVAPTQVSVAVNGVLSDASGNTVDLSKSYVTVVVVAWTGATTTTNLLSAPFSVASGSNNESPPISLPDSFHSILQACMSGFYLAYPQTDHHVLNVNASVGSTANGSDGYITATANMSDDSGNTAQNPTGTGFLIASSDKIPSFIVVPYTAQNAGQQTIPMGSVKLSDAFVLLTGFQVQFPDNDDHEISNIGAGPNTWVCQSDDTGSRVVSSGVWAWMGNDDGDTQDMSLSSASVIAVGILDQSE
ncbi:hypothetical protein G6M50_12105 [Agrobacterium rhizogenes]|nr:hypothetical protein [Rhizobium rhizogenes]NTJ78525.1 hypothetical protein [Rhizobium rhizogenes]